jgi:hypothetical protein
MLRLWFDETSTDAIDTYPLLTELQHGENYAIVPTLEGKLHRIAFSASRWPVAARITLSASQLGVQDASGVSLREKIIARLEDGAPVTAFVDSTEVALSIVFTALRPAMLADSELVGGGQETVALEGVVTADGTFTDFGSLASVVWRARE